ncbi:MAG TPA: rhodanese-like domain-containing protein [Gemmata sp.]|nr:rhodanese-like domain-containing protein [Gemmata sp.]
MTRFVWGAVAAVLIAGTTIAAEHTKDSIETVKKNVVEKKAILVDVRENGEWNDGHLKDAKHVSLSRIRKGIPIEDLKKTLPAGSVVYLHCASGKRCLIAADLLKKEGYDVRPLKDGYENLLKEGFPKAK